MISVKNNSSSFMLSQWFMVCVSDGAGLVFILSFFPAQRLQEAETRNQELSQSVTSATRPLLRQIENLQATLGAQTVSWEKLEKSISDRLGETCLCGPSDQSNNKPLCDIHICDVCHLWCKNVCHLLIVPSWCSSPACSFYRERTLSYRGAANY